MHEKKNNPEYQDQAANLYGFFAGVAFLIALLFVAIHKAPEKKKVDPGFKIAPSQSEVDSIEFETKPFDFETLKNQINE